MAADGQRPSMIAGLGLPIRALVMMVRDPEERGPMVLVLSLLVVGSAFYMIVEGWGPVDAVYFCTMSLATVG